MTVELRREDFGEWDRDDVYTAGAQLLGVVADISFHNCNPGEGWSPFCEITGDGDVPALIREVRGHIERLEEAIKEAKAGIAAVERPARLAAIRRTKKAAT